MRYRLYQIIQRAEPGDKTSRVYDLFIVCVALLSLVPLTFKEWDAVLYWWDLITVYILFFDYVLRWITNDFRTGKTGWKAFARYPFTPWAIVDLLGILPSLGLLPVSFKFLRVLRLFKVLRYSRSLTLVSNVLKSEKDTLLSVLVIALGYIFVSALLMFTYEPDTFDNFFGALYWATTALTTVGYGDVYPHSDVGRVISMVSSIFGIAVIALPAGIVTGGFMDQMNESRKHPATYYKVADESALLNPTVNDKFLGVLRSDPRFMPSLVFMGLCCVLNAVFYELAAAAGLPVWLDTVGTALCSVALGPYAGILVALVDNLYLCTVHYDTSAIVYFSTSAMAALCYGCLLHPLRHGKWKQQRKHAAAMVAVTILILTVGVAILDYIFLLWLNGGAIADPQELAIALQIESMGLAQAPAYFCALLVERFADAVAVCALCALLWPLCRRSAGKAAGETTR